MRCEAPVAVVGAGIGGLAAALALAQRGFAVDLLERSERLEEVGAGLQLSPNALRVLERLGVLEALRPRALEARVVSLRDLRSGRALANVPVRGSDGTPYLSVLRADLQNALLDSVAEVGAIRLKLGAHVTGIDHDANGCELTLDGDAGKSFEAPAVIAADGVRSGIAAALRHEAAKASGLTAWRMTVPANEGAPANINAWLAPRCHIVAYPVDAGRRTNVVIVASERVRDASKLLESRDDFLRTLGDPARTATPWPLLEVDRRRRPTDPRSLLLIGDAAHAMTPFAAQGAALAIEDGYAAAACLLEAPDAGSAWQRFEAVRRPRWERVRKRAAFHRTVYHLPRVLAFGRDAVLRVRSPEALARDLGWLYDWQPPPAP